MPRATSHQIPMCMFSSPASSCTCSSEYEPSGQRDVAVSPRGVTRNRNLAIGALHRAGRHDTSEATRWARSAAWTGPSPSSDLHHDLETAGTVPCALTCLLDPPSPGYPPAGGEPVILESCTRLGHVSW